MNNYPTQKLWPIAAASTLAVFTAVRTGNRDVASKALSVIPILLLLSSTAMFAAIAVSPASARSSKRVIAIVLALAAMLAMPPQPQPHRHLTDATTNPTSPPQQEGHWNASVTLPTTGVLYDHDFEATVLYDSDFENQGETPAAFHAGSEQWSRLITIHPDTMCSYSIV
jgi:hypothetical protein